MVKICQTGLQKLNFEIIPKKRIFQFLPKNSAGHGWSWKIFFANFQILGPLGCQGWVVIPQIVKKSQNHCTLIRNMQEKSKFKLHSLLTLHHQSEILGFYRLHNSWIGILIEFPDFQESSAPDQGKTPSPPPHPGGVGHGRSIIRDIPEFPAG